MTKALSFAIIRGDARQDYLRRLLEEDGHKARMIDGIAGAADILRPEEIVVALRLEEADRFALRQNGLAWVEYDQEAYWVANAVITAENALQVAMDNLERTLNQSRALVIGYGRVAKPLSAMLRGIGAHVTVAARKREDLELIAGGGMQALQARQLADALPAFDVIFNTVPHLVLDEERLLQVRRDTLIIDLASKPGGVDFTTARKLGRPTIHALALPGKLTPISAAQAIRNTVYSRLEEGDMIP